MNRNEGHSLRARRLIILGSTGSIGTQTLEVVAHLRALADRGEDVPCYEVVGLAAGRSADLLGRQAARFGVREVAMASHDGLSSSSALSRCTVRSGRDAAERLVREVECDVVLAAMVGVAGLPATLAAVELGRDVALANKETLVAAGELVVPAARRSGSRLLPVDSEHSGVWQCLQGLECAGASPKGDAASSLVPPFDVSRRVRRVMLTASGGPFREWPSDRVRRATPAEALNHPTWKMGRKVTIDSASLTNKALEVIEAHWLFGLPADQIGVLVHPQSIVHSLVEFNDGSVIAQLGAPDMRCPINYALTWPRRPEGCCRRLDWSAFSRLDFAPPDLERFPALGLGFEVCRRGGTSGAVFNAANEVAVEAFLAADGAMPFGRIAETTCAVMEEHTYRPLSCMGDVLEADASARALSRRRLGS
ncbi:MAG: 1-deoxy-D-xylulose-5-phosphate reductoisomerase [Phycisphaerales bacterium]|nr:1-deoxy-D-xylulose-5-phosphate reductoisomerase [Phycisphaerales bacterium]